jgi:hypothetical protein
MQLRNKREGKNGFLANIECHIYILSNIIWILPLKFCFFFYNFDLQKKQIIEENCTNSSYFLPGKDPNSSNDLRKLIARLTKKQNLLNLIMVW